MKKTVKARKRYGAGIDLTIPTEIVKDYGINVGDVFEISVDDNKELMLIYKRVYEGLR